MWHELLDLAKKTLKNQLYQSVFFRREAGAAFFPASTTIPF
jgi:hypothetical protein